MINVIIYLKKKQNPEELITFLLSEKLIASASIDENNVSYKMNNGFLTEEVHTIITAQSKALLFDNIVDAIEQKMGEKMMINAIPIVGASGFFNDTVRTKTKLT
jgi:uncharacterized protein involved in tolerance to divalent cations